MRFIYLAIFGALLGCGSKTVAVTMAPSTAETAPATEPTAPTFDLLTADTPKTTVVGNPFVAPRGWTLVVRNEATILEAPEGGSFLAFVDVKGKDADEAVSLAWKAFGSEAKWPIETATNLPDSDGWSRRRQYVYRTPPNDKRRVVALALFANDTWTVVIYDIALAVGEKRLAQVGVTFGSLLPKGYVRETHAGKRAHTLDAGRLAQLTEFVETAQKQLQIPGVSLGIIQDGRVVFTGGFGVRELGKEGKVDADTRFMIGSNTKALTTLMLAKLVDNNRIRWDTQVKSLLPGFKLGDEATTDQVRVKHLVCACTGLPRQDLEWMFQYAEASPDGVVKNLASMQPTSAFGELFQYSNLLAAVGGFVGGHVAFPKLELGKAYDEAMRTLVFEPLGMGATTCDFAAARRKNYVSPHAPDINGTQARITLKINDSIIPVRPAGAAWSNVHDMLKYVQMELDDGKLPDGTVYISKDALLERRVPQVTIGDEASYGMGLMVNKKKGVSVIHHGGDTFGHHSDMMWLPEHGVGAVVLTNGDPGWLIADGFSSRLVEVLFDGRPEIQDFVKAAGEQYFSKITAQRKLLEIPANAAEVVKLAPRYTNASLGNIVVNRSAKGVTFDVGEWQSEMASRRNTDGTVSFVTITPGILSFDFVVGSGTKRTLTVRDAQHEYVFTEQ